MRDNGPVTGREVELKEGDALVSKTDTGGRITFVNKAFIDISGFVEDELIGAPHNLVRHPDMPKVAFADLWATVKAGLPWEGLVKNRCKNGDHYWVRANVTPLVEDGQTIGFISIRSKPSRDEINAAEELYKSFREGRAGGLTLKEGALLKTGAAARFSRFALSLKGRITGMVAVFTLVSISAAAVGLIGMSHSNDAIRTVYEDRVVPAAQLGELKEMLVENVATAGRFVQTKGAAARISDNLARADKVWQAYLATYLTPEEKTLAETYAKQRAEYAEFALKPLASGSVADWENHYLQAVAPGVAAPLQTLTAMIDLQKRVAKEVYEEADADLSEHMTGGISALLLGLLLSMFLARKVSVGVRLPLNRMETNFGAIARGDFTHNIAFEPMPDFQRTTAMLRAMRAKLGYGAIEAAEASRRGEETLKREMLTLTQTLEGEIQETVGEISTQAKRLSDGSVELQRVSDELREMASHVTEAVQVTSGNVQTVAGATEELEASSREITSQVMNSSRLAEEARSSVDLASQRVAGLSEATARIGGVVTMIRNIAGQTRMLALNATIEAARAGEAGKGFAVVAEEVKSLAEQTEQAIGTVSAQAEEIGSTTRDAVETVESVAHTIREIDTIAGEVASSADEQRSATAEIMGSAAQAAEHTRSVADNVGLMMDGVQATGDTARRVNELAGMVSRDIAALQRRMYVIMRTNYGGDRRHAKRITAALPFTATFAAGEIGGFTGDIDLSGAFLVPAGGARPSVGSLGEVSLTGIAKFKCKLVGDSGAGLHVQFIDPPADARTKLAERLEQSIAADEPFMKIVTGVAEQASAALEAALQSGKIDREALFDVEYAPIPGTNPPQVLARHTELADSLFPEFIEPPLAKDPGIIFCCITDRNGYIAAHNKKYSNPQKPDDPIWNAANARNRRVFDDRTGILAARTAKPLAHTYVRDMGGGNYVVLKEMDAPIKAGGRHWGAVRMAMKLG